MALVTSFDHQCATMSTMMMEGRIGDNWWKTFPTNLDATEPVEVCTVTLEFDVRPQYAQPILQKLMTVAQAELTGGAVREDVLAAINKTREKMFGGRP